MPQLPDFEDAAGSTLEQLQQSGTVTVVYHGMAFLDSAQNDDYSTRALNAAAVVASDAGTGPTSSSTTCSTPTSPTSGPAAGSPTTS